MEYSKPIGPDDLFSAKGLVVVITGAGSGIGRAFATALARSGAAKVFLLGRRLAKLQETSAQVSAAAGSSSTANILQAVECDVTDPESLSQAVATVAKLSPGGHIDVLINNAGLEGPRATDVSTANTIEELATAMSRGIKDEAGTGGSGWDATWRTNTVAVIGVSAAFLPLLDKGNRRRGWDAGKKDGSKGEHNKQSNAEVMRSNGIEVDDRRSSQIITVASISAFNRFITAGLAYTASKAGAVMLGKSMSTFLAPWAIRSNVIAPGRFPSEMMTDTSYSVPANQIPHGSTGSYEDLASLVLFMVGKSGTYMNGCVQVLDGGRLSVMPGTY